MTTKRDTRESVPVDTEHCGDHCKVLTRGEFWTVAALLIGLAVTVAGYFSSTAASAESVENVHVSLAHLKAQLAEEKEERKDLADQWREDFRLLRNDIKAELRDLKKGR